VQGYIITNNKNNEINEGKINKLLNKNSLPMREHTATPNTVTL
jgi:hypothetical protein